MQKMKLALVSVVFACFQAAAVDSDNSEIPADYNVNELKVDSGYLKAWGITKEEYARFIYLKRNTPRGVITPQANPLYYLGLEARTKEERQRYAEKVAQMEFENIEKGKVWRKAVQLAGAKLYGRGDLVELSEGEELERELEKVMSQYRSSNSKSTAYGSVGKVRSIFVSLDCDSCVDEYKKALKGLDSGDLVRLVIVFPNGTSDSDVRRWATSAGIPIELNKRGVIELRFAESNESVKKYPTVVNADF